ncbi:LOW QUALITY PROTEIN: hypothetical protein HID58_090622 [Brassica napus]|uniref:Amino acid transporter transmembrane domain-containing protein n=1 Tax=Brassica napus TaxID=3708 RepID=A0ABQ7XD87_BRANA|nr:LOW QUALITY PROTEIN: hypothetical protein HID58_090622 [Brassica napus]
MNIQLYFVHVPSLTVKRLVSFTLLSFHVSSPPLTMKSLDTLHNPSAVESGNAAVKNVDDDGREKRTGTFLTASAHIITAVIGSGVLSLAWALAQLGWVAGTMILVIFAIITYYTSTLLADCYRAPDPITGTRNYTYMGVVRAYLGGKKVQLCGLAQYGNLVGVSIGYTITASISLVEIGRANCFHDKGHGAKCTASNYPYMVAFGGLQILLSQIPNFHKLSFLSIIAAVMSFSYASIGIGLAIAKVASGKVGKTTLTGTVIGVDVSASDKVWKAFQAVGDIAFRHIEIKPTREQSDEESKSYWSLNHNCFLPLMWLHWVCCIRKLIPGDFLTDFGFYEPFWLVIFANVCIAVHLVGAYQVYVQPFFQFVESKCNKKWPESNFINKEYSLKIPLLGKFRAGVEDKLCDFDNIYCNDIPLLQLHLGLLGALAFWPLTVYFPVAMHIAQTKVKKYSDGWREPPRAGLLDCVLRPAAVCDTLLA